MKVTVIEIKKQVEEYLNLIGHNIRQIRHIFKRHNK